MIYKCKDCGKEYNNKPEFCDCGNNFFEIIKEQEDNIVKPVKTIQHHKVNSDIHKENKPQINYKLINSIIAILIFTIILLICFSLKKTEVQQPEKESQKDVVKTEDVNNTPKKEIEIYIEEPKIKTEAKQPTANQQETVKRQEKTNEISKASKDNNKQQKNQTTTNPKTTKKQIVIFGFAVYVS